MQMVLSNDEDARKLVLLMEEQRDLQIVHEQRITQVETRLSVVEIKQTTLDKALEKLVDLVAGQATKTTLNEAAIVAIRERTDILADHMEKVTDRLASKQEDDGAKATKMETRMARLDAQMNVVKAIGAALIGAAALVGLEHFFH